MTIFKLVQYFESGDESIVECYPATGRTHQIRVHLLAVHHPIVNDVKYNTKARKVSAGDKVQQWLMSEEQPAVQSIVRVDTFCPEVSPMELRRLAEKRRVVGCPECGESFAVTGRSGAQSDDVEAEGAIRDELCLHASSYRVDLGALGGDNGEGCSFVFHAPDPDWVSDPTL